MIGQELAHLFNRRKVADRDVMGARYGLVDRGQIRYELSFLVILANECGHLSTQLRDDVGVDLARGNERHVNTKR